MPYRFQTPILQHFLIIMVMIQLLEIVKVDLLGPEVWALP